MNIGAKLANLFTNKYFLYFIVFLAATNILGYLITNNIRPVLYFALISLLTSYFSNNMIVILLVGLIATNMLVANNILREGLENNLSMTSDDEEKLVDIDEELKQGVDALKSTNGNVSKAKEIMENQNLSNSTMTNEIKDPNNPQINMVVEEFNQPMPSDIDLSNKKITQGFTNLY